MMPKLDIVSIKVMVKPSSPTPNHLRDFKISLVDEMAPPIYIPIILFYSATDINSSFGTHDVETISNKLKVSLSKVLTLYYPFCGRFKCTSPSSVDCNDEGVPYIECKFPTNLIDILKRSQSQMQELLPFDPYNNVSSSLDHNDDKHKVTMAVQLSEFKCGGIALGVCLSHKVADGEATSSFLNAWAKTAKGLFNQVDPPQMDAALIFPPRGIEWAITSLMVGGGNEKLVTKCFLFSPTDLSRLRARFGSFNPTRVEAVTALIWKSAIQVAKGSSSGECNRTCYKASMVCHAVDIRNRMVPPLPKNLFGNLWLYSISELVDLGDGGYGTEELCDLVGMVRNAVRETSAGYSDMLLQGDGLDEFDEFFKEARLRVAENLVACCGFSSWTRFGFYEVDFGWGKPIKVRNINLPMKNVTYLIPTRTGDGIEAWVTMTEPDMDEFQRNSDLLQFALLES
ncbi:stemmadenine O-acetyltransferase-like [Arachis stenosperma]|uniref:stemmadenine O-acetyltransferase-like n=1 Tax=Arachis stenosperma TaxID=217475 RepID=UPI0025AC1961|nr:stemmadenine O-acetyltransferase-like [Arachis stenosperma]